MLKNINALNLKDELKSGRWESWIKFYNHFDNEII